MLLVTLAPAPGAPAWRAVAKVMETAQSGGTLQLPAARAQRFASRTSTQVARVRTNPTGVCERDFSCVIWQSEMFADTQTQVDEHGEDVHSRRGAP